LRQVTDAVKNQDVKSLVQCARSDKSGQLERGRG